MRILTTTSFLSLNWGLFVPKLRLSFLAFLLSFAVTSVLAQTTIRVPTDQPTIQAGINAARTGDTVLVSAGTYYENLLIDSKEIILRSTSGATSTILDGGSKGVVITINSTPSSATTIDGFTIRNGSPSAAPFDGGIHVDEAGATIQNNIITHNVGYGIAADLSNVIVLNNQIDTVSPIRDQYHCPGYPGISLFATSYGTKNLPVSFVIRGNVITGDGTKCSGDGISSFAAGKTLIENNTITGNFTGIAVYSDEVTIRQNLVTGSHTGGLFLEHSEGAFPTTDPPTDFVTNNTFVNNTASSAVLKAEYGNPSAELYFYASVSRTALNNNIVVGNSDLPLIACDSTNDATPLILDHDDLINLSAAPGPLMANNCGDVVATPIGINGNITSNPMFVSGTDFHLHSGSPAIDAGNNSLVLTTSDFDGDPRILDSKGNGFPIVDLGAYEASGLADLPVISVALASSSYYLPAIASITLTSTAASSAPIPSGAMQFFQDDRSIGNVAMVSGAATLSVQGLTPGLYRFRTVFTGAGLADAISNVIYVRVLPYQSQMQLVSSPNPSFVGQSVAFMATVASADGAVPSPIVFSEYGNTLATVNTDPNGRAIFNTATLSLGYHTITAAYAGDPLHSAVSRQVTQLVVNGYTTTTTLSSSVNPSGINQSVTFTARVTSSNGVPTGSVIFTDGPSNLGSQTLNASGNAALSTSALGSGPHTITATYVPTGSFASSSLSLTQQVNGLPTSSALSVSAPTPYSGDPVSLTATITSTSPGTPAGSVIFFADGTAFASPVAVANGTATLTTSSLRPGTHALTCVYSGDSTFAGSNCAPVSLVVTSLPTSMTLVSSGNLAPALSPVTFTANLTSRGKPYNGIVLFYVDGKSLKAVSPDANGNATFAVPFSTGSYVVSAQFPGNDGTDASYASITQVVVPNPTTTTLAPPSGPIYQNQPAAFAITVAAVTGASSPNGSIALYEGTALLGQAATQPSASGTVIATVRIPVTLLSGGTHILSAVYTPDLNFLASISTPLTITVAPQTFTLSLSAPSMSVQIEHHIGFSASLQSVGGFSGPVQLTCAPPPDIYFTCDITASKLQLAANASATSEFVLDTDAVLRFKSSLDGAPHHRAINLGAVSLAALLPLSLFGFGRRRRHALPMLLALAFLAATLCFTGCSSKYPAHTPPGTYDIPITAIGTSAGSSAAVTHTVHMQVTVKP